MRDSPLPGFPSGGNRRMLDAQWQERVEKQGRNTLIQEHLLEVPPDLGKAVQEFNQGQFWVCHETLEHLWLDTPYPLRLFYHGVIKLAVGFYHLSRHNRHGTHAKLGDGIEVLRLFRPHFFGIETGLLIQETQIWLDLMEQAGALQWDVVDSLTRPKIHKVKL